MSMVNTNYGLGNTLLIIFDKEKPGHGVTKLVITLSEELYSLL